jgi:hypothetical protein
MIGSGVGRRHQAWSDVFINKSTWRIHQRIRAIHFQIFFREISHRCDELRIEALGINQWEGQRDRDRERSREVKRERERAVRSEDGQTESDSTAISSIDREWILNWLFSGIEIKAVKSLKSIKRVGSVMPTM